MTAKHKHNNHDLYDDVEKLKAALFDTAYDAKGKANDLLYDSVEGIKEHTNDIKESVIDYATEKPLQSLGIALLAGIAIGFLLRK